MNNFTKRTNKNKVAFQYLCQIFSNIIDARLRKNAGRRWLENIGRLHTGESVDNVIEDFGKTYCMIFTVL